MRVALMWRRRSRHVRFTFQRVNLAPQRNDARCQHRTHVTIERRVLSTMGHDLGPLGRRDSELVERLR
jgi:hypothetical protein